MPPQYMTKLREVERDLEAKLKLEYDQKLDAELTKKEALHK